MAARSMPAVIWTTSYVNDSANVKKKVSFPKSKTTSLYFRYINFVQMIRNDNKFSRNLLFSNGIHIISFSVCSYSIPYLFISFFSRIKFVSICFFFCTNAHFFIFSFQFIYLKNFYCRRDNADFIQQTSIFWGTKVSSSNFIFVLPFVISWLRTCRRK